jgi:hypothetical protein
MANSTASIFIKPTVAFNHGDTFVFGSWVCTADGAGSFQRRLTMPPNPETGLVTLPEVVTGNLARKFDAIRGKSKQNTGGGSNNNGNQGGRSNNYSGPNRKRKPDNTFAAIQRPAKDNSKKTSGGFNDLLKEKCPWHLDGSHTTKQCYQLRRALKDTLEPRHPHDKKGKKKTDESNGDFQETDKIVNILFGGLPN